MAKQLGRHTVKELIIDLQLQVQRGKVSASKKDIKALQLQDNFSEEYTSFHSSIRPSNEYRTPQKFFDTMERKPKLWAKKFFFIGQQDSRLAEAAVYAINLVERQANKYGVITGLYKRSFRMLLNDIPFTTKQRLFDPSLGDDSVFTIYNATEYASTSEVNALYYSRIGGILFYAANQTFRRFPELGVVFAYTDAAIGLNHQYAVPFLSIGPKELIRGGITRPGSNRKGRRRVSSARRRTARSINRRYN